MPPVTKLHAIACRRTALRSSNHWAKYGESKFLQGLFWHNYEFPLYITAFVHMKDRRWA